MFVVCAENIDLELFSLVSWALWNRRNNLSRGKPSILLEQLLDRAREITLGCLPGSTSASTTLKQAAASWTPPTLHGYKINFDGAIFEQENRASLGVVIQNHDGMVTASLSEIISLPSIVIEVETLIAWQAVEFALGLGFDNIFLEGDFEVLIKLLNNSSRSLAPFGHIINDILFLASRFSCFNVAHVQRQCNKVAHSLARIAIFSSHLSIWMEDVPLDLLTVI